MKEAKISEIKNGFSHFLRLVRQGETIRVLDRDVPVAKIVPISQTAKARGGEDERLAGMERKGLIRRGTGRLDRALLRSDPPGRPSGVLDALLEERRSR
jgi:prevent-host-death family protein